MSGVASGRFTALPLVVRELEVLRVTERGPRMRRVTVGGPELGAFDRDGLALPAFTSLAFDDHVKFVLAPDGDIAEALPLQRENGIEWPTSQVRVTRDYTPVQVDPVAGEVSFDFVLHSGDGARGDGSAAGPAERWAAAARPGHTLWAVGPKSSTIVPDDAEWTLLVGDETGIPAIERFLLERPVDGPVTVVLAVAEAAATPELPLAQADSLVTVVAEPGDPHALGEAVCALPRPVGTGYVWAGAESRALLPVRKRVTRDWGIAKSHVNITGYWHRTAGAAEHAGGVDQDRHRAAGRLLPVLAGVVHSPVSWFAVRIALRSGLLRRLESGPIRMRALAERLGVGIEQLGPLIELLAAADVVGLEDGAVSLTPDGELLIDDEHVAELFDGARADQVMLLADLEQALGADTSNWARHRGASFWAQAAEDPAEYRELMEAAGRLAFLVPALKTVPAVAGSGPVTVVGPGAAVLATALAGEGRAIRIVEPRSVLPALAADVAASEVEITDVWARGRDTVVLGGLALAARDDAEAFAYLSELRHTASTVVLAEATGTDALGPDALEQALLRVAVCGARPRTRDDLRRLAARAGWSVDEVWPLGWGVEAISLTHAPR
ncbi:hypothetical protein GCM10023217_27700 [Gordonia alkaliphila]|uniref:FAD-binding FR-type domain-containing protein n=1 Tax=Gordonia alkaliphila TaxID=1053547 RepID=A0ABP8ZEI1_9ACTN